MKKTTQLRKLIAGAAERTPLGAAAGDGLTAKLVEEAGFDFVISAGFMVSATLGLPDAELYSMSENLAMAARIVESTGLPVVADIDTGYGNAINVMRTVREFERVGVAAVVLEDQVSPKRCPALQAPEIEAFDVALGKVKAAVDARIDSDLVIIARTDATDVDEACRRAEAYARAGADLIYTITACGSCYEDMLRIRQAAGIPYILHMFKWVEDFTSEQVRSLAGLAGWTFPALLTSTHAVRTNLTALRERRSSRGLPLPMTELADFKTLIGFPEIENAQAVLAEPPHRIAIQSFQARVNSQTNKIPGDYS